jgi:hypothetical protein
MRERKNVDTGVHEHMREGKHEPECAGECEDDGSDERRDGVRVQA